MNIRQRRLAQGWSQEELARHSGLSTRTIQRIEGGHQAGLESLKSLAAVFETSVSALTEEQPATKKQGADDPMPQTLLKIETDAIEFAQSILRDQGKGDQGTLSKLEREAISYAKRIMRRLKVSAP